VRCFCGPRPLRYFTSGPLPALSLPTKSRPIFRIFRILKIKQWRIYRTPIVYTPTFGLTPKISPAIFSSFHELMQSCGVRRPSLCLSVSPSVNFAQFASSTTEMAGSPPNLHTMVPRRACIQDVLKVKVEVKGHVILALLWVSRNVCYTAWSHVLSLHALTLWSTIILSFQAARYNV